MSNRRLRSVAASLLPASLFGAAFVAACVGDDPIAGTSSDAGGQADTGTGDAGSTNGDAATSDGSTLPSDSGPDAPTCQKLTENFEAPLWQPTTKWPEVVETKGGSFDLDSNGHGTGNALRFTATNFESKAYLARSLPSQCTFRFDAWIYLQPESAGDGTSLVIVDHANGFFGLGLSGRELRIGSSTAQNPAGQIKKTITDSAWTHIVVDYDATSGELGLTTDTRVSTILENAAPVTKVTFGILGATNGGEHPDEISYDDIDIAY